MKAVKTETTTGPRKLTVEKIEIAKQAPGFTFEGKYVGTALSEPFQRVNKETGEIVTKTITFAIFERQDGERFKVAQDAGLRAAMSDALVKEGNLIRVVKLEKVVLKNSRSMNQYDIYAV